MIISKGSSLSVAKVGKKAKGRGRRKKGKKKRKAMRKRGK